MILNFFFKKRNRFCFRFGYSDSQARRSESCALFSDQVDFRNRPVDYRLGPRALRDVHIHIAGIHYGDKGEIKHLNLEDADFRYDEWLQALRDLAVEGLVICESPNLEEDALMLKKLYLAQTTKS